jgi:hypothetical protein
LLYFFPQRTYVHCCWCSHCFTYVCKGLPQLQTWNWQKCSSCFIVHFKRHQVVSKSEFFKAFQKVFSCTFLYFKFTNASILLLFVCLLLLFVCLRLSFCFRSKFSRTSWVSTQFLRLLGNSLGGGTIQ